MTTKQPIVRHRSQVEPMPCPFGTTTRVVTGGEGGVANVHIIRVTQGGLHLHTGYDETYYVLQGTGVILLDGERHPLSPGSVVVIPANVAHELQADDEANPLEFVIFGTPALSVDDPRARPTRPA